ncbi:MAG: hypothetical protein II277_03095 [Bacteroidales bacterium]|nr:hypothetical protein [Bacteroidales bacterium]
MNQERRNKRNAQYKINLEKRHGITKNSDWLEKGSGGIEKSEKRNPMDGHYEFVTTRNKKGNVVTRNKFIYKWTAQAKAIQKLYHDTKNGIPEKPKKPLNLFFDVPRTKEEIKEHFKSTPVAIIYDIWFVGMILSVIFVQSMSITRMLLYFTQLAIFVMAYALEYFRREKPDYFWVMLALMLLTFVATIMDGDSNTATYIFNWQDEHFHLKKAFMKL